MTQIILFNKPFQVLCQFSKQDQRATLADFIPIKNIYAAGRLDYDSEGLLLLTDDGTIQHQLTDPKHKQIKTYWLQIEKVPEPAALDQLREGVQLNDGKTQAAEVKIISTPPTLWPRDPPIRHRLTVPTCWLEISISEGKNRQLRRMTAAIGHPTLRLIRTKIGPYTLGNLQPGQYCAHRRSSNFR